MEQKLMKVDYLDGEAYEIAVRGHRIVGEFAGRPIRVAPAAGHRQAGMTTRS
jgi:hypothetical protein